MAAHSPAELSAIACIVSMSNGDKGCERNVKKLVVDFGKEDGTGSLIKLRRGTILCGYQSTDRRACQQAIGPGLLYPFASADSRAAPSHGTSGAEGDLLHGGA